MKKMNLKVVSCLLAGGLLYSSCIGSYSLFNGYAKWQRTMTDNKFVNAIVGFILTPIVGSICLLVDAVVLNTIEFWTGSNPMHKTTELFRFNPDGTITTLADKDMQLTVTPDEAGVYQVRTAVGGGYFFAMR